MKLLITNNEENIAVAKDFTDLDKSKTGLIGQVRAELELIKKELLFIYSGGLEEDA